MGITGIRAAVLLLWCVLAASGQECVFNVEGYGARGDGTTDNSKAFSDAWAATCAAPAPSASLLVPAWKTFLVGPTKFSGPCASNRVTFQVMGKLVAPPASEWIGRHAKAWLLFYQVNGLKVTGAGGVLDGNGQSWWPLKCRHVVSPLNTAEEKGCIAHAPTALMLVNCNWLELSYITSKDSPQMHVVITKSEDVSVANLTVTAPEKSPNTDGIHISESQDVRITGSTVGTGDDCVSIVSGSRFVTVDSIICGPGHGVSVGSLGRNGATETVENIDVKNVQFVNTMNGVRIKTWEGGKGYARHISFSNISFSNVAHPVVINQKYVDRSFPDLGAVAITNITYSNLRGTSSRRTAVEFDCSTSVSCTEIHVSSMEITAPNGREAEARCQNVQGHASGYVSPKIPCLTYIKP